MVGSEHRILPLPRLDPAPTVLVVIAPYYADIAALQRAGAEAVLSAAGARVDWIEVPGALEIATTIRLAEEAQRYEGYVALGCVVRGETTHYETVCEESARGLTMLGTGTGICIGNGILTVEDMEQARCRADPADMDKGGGAATAALHLIAIKRKFRPAPPPAKGRPLPGSEEDILLAASQTRTA